MSEVLQTANGPVLWSMALLAVGVVIIQSVLIYRLAKRHALKNKLLTEEEIKICLRTGGITAVGPAMAVFILALSMMSMMGAPATLMRVGMIGSADTEILVASMGAGIAGVTLGAEELTYVAFGTALLAGAITSGGYFILTPLLSRGLGKSLTKLFDPKPGKKPSKLGTFFAAGFPILVFGALAASQLMQGVDYLIIMIISAVTMFVLNKISKEKNITWLKEWAMGLSVLMGLVCAPFIASLF